MISVEEILDKSKVFAVVGVSENKEKYGCEAFETSVDNGFKAYPINPKYVSIREHRC